MTLKLTSPIFLILFAINLPLLAENIGATQTSLPLEFNTGNAAPYGLPSTVVIIQGKSIPIIFDTGAKKSELTLSESALKGINVKFTGNHVCSTAFDGKHCEKEFIIPEVKLGSFVLKNVKGTLMSKLWGGNEQGFISTKASKNGVIGYGLLSQFNVFLDYPHNQVVLFQKKSQLKYNFSQWTAIPFTDHLLTSVVLNGKKITLGWDTGSIPSIIKASVVKDIQLSACEKNTPYGKGDDCRRIISKTFNTTDGTKLPVSWFFIRDIPSVAPFDGLIGSNFYMENLVYFDFDNHKIFVKKSSNDQG